MNWLQKMFFKAAAGPVFRFAPQWVRHSFLPVNWGRLIDAYHKNSAVAACVTTLAFSFSEPPLIGGRVEDGRFVADYTHPIMKLIRQPNPDMGEVELMQFAPTYAAVGGTFYVWKQRRQNGQVMALWPFSEAQMHAVPGHDTSEGFVAGYELDTGQGPMISIPKEDVIQWKWMPDPEQPWRGMGALESAIREADKDTEASTFIYALLKNNSVPPVVVTLAEGDDFSEDKADRLRAQWKAKLGGENAGNVAFIEAGMKAEKMGFNLQELAAETLNAVPEARIAAAFRVPPVVAGLSVGLKRSDYGDQAARRSFTELTLTALWRSLASELTNGLRADFRLPDNFELRFDLRQVRALLEEETKIWERVTLAFDRGGITRKMMKEMLGLKPEAGDDVYKVSLATEFIPAAGDGAVVRGQEPVKALDLTPGPSPKGEGSKSRGSAALRRIRVDVAGRMKQAVDVYFSQLADRVIERAGKSIAPPALTPAPLPGGEGKKLPRAEQLVNGDDRKKLEEIVKRFYVQVIELSWDTWNVTLGVEKAFDLLDPIVTRILGMAGTRVKEIHDETLKQIRQALQNASDRGWGVDQLVRGDPANGVRGLREIVDETYKDRARVIARTELGEAQNAATAERYRDAGVKLVEILDNGSEDDDEECKVANGQIWTLAYFEAHSLEHPNCTRAAAPYFGDAKPDRG